MAYNLLKGKRGIITGALDENSIAWKVAQKCHEEGATFTLTNAPIAMRLGEINKLSEETGAKIIPADATNMEDITKLYTESMDVLGGKIDFVLHSIGMSVNIRKNIPYTELNYDFYQKGIDVSALSFHKMLAAAHKLDALNEHASVVALSYIGAQRTYPFYTDMADIKAMLESIARTFGYHYVSKWTDREWTYSLRLTAMNNRQNLVDAVINPALALLQMKSATEALPDNLLGLVFYPETAVCVETDQA